MKKTVTVRLQGTKVGTIWMPACEAWKDFDQSFDKGKFGDVRLSREIESLGEALEQITNDGDFQSCRIGNCYMTVSYRKGGRTVSRSRELTGTDYPEMFHADYPWYPPMGEE